MPKSDLENHLQYLLNTYTGMDLINKPRAAVTSRRFILYSAFLGGIGSVQSVYSEMGDVLHLFFFSPGVSFRKKMLR